MRRLLIIVFILLTLPFKTAFCAEPDPAVIRKHLVTALKSSKTTDSLYKSLDAIKNKSGLVTGYIATLQALKAVHAWNPYLKIKYLNRAEKTYKEAVAADPANIEIRFMRFSVEHNVPGFLGYNKNLTADREQIIAQLKKKNYAPADHEFITTVIKFLLDSKRCTPVENEYLTRQLTALK
jgi:hypothetical protein